MPYHGSYRIREREGGQDRYGDGGFLGSEYDSDDNSTAAQVHRFFAKVEGLGIDLGEDMCSPIPGLNLAR